MELATCPRCDGTGWVTSEGHGGVERCDCFRSARAGRRLERAGIPRRYRHCTLENFETEFLNADPSLGGSVLKCERYIEGFADLAGSERVKDLHLMEALGFRLGRALERGGG